MLKKINIQINGIHCKSCKVLIETELDVLEGVKDVDVNYQTGETNIEFDDGKISQEKIFKEIEKLKYTVDTKEKKKTNSFSKNLIIAGLLLIFFVIGYFLVKQFGFSEILSRLNDQNLSYWLILFIGFLVSFHCIGMCGGLVITYTTTSQSKSKKSLYPHFQYNLGRLISYSIIGGILGGFGSFFAVNPTFTGVITLIAGAFMLLMGLSFLTQFKWLEKIKLRTPEFIARFLYNQRYSGKPKGPFIIGILNGFMPCGPLQAIQLYALASGSIITGALSMGFYALGTVPLMFGFGSFISLISQDRIKQVMKFSGIIVIVLALFMINRGLTNFGYGFRGFNQEDGQSEYLVDGEEFQVVNMELTYKGYSPNVIYIKKDIPVRWVINVKQMSGCTDEIHLPEYNIKKKLQKGENIIEFVPDRLGEIKFSCWMQMVWGKFIVTEEESSSENTYEEQVGDSSNSCSGTCGDTCGSSTCGCSN